MNKHEHSFVLAKFSDNSEHLPPTLYSQAISDYRWQAIALYICECGEKKEVFYE